METIAAVGLAVNVVQFIDFTCRLFSKSTQLCRSSQGVPVENIDVESATNDLVLLNERLGAATTTGNKELEDLCQSCRAVAHELLEALDQVKVKGQQQGWASMRKAIRSVWSKGKIAELERRLARFREELNLRIIADLRCVSPRSPVSNANNICVQKGKSLSTQTGTVQWPG